MRGVKGATADLGGMRFGRLVALAGSLTKGKWDYSWECQCDCGTVKRIQRANLVNGFTKSCGCLARETMAAVGRSGRLHGLSKTRLYRIYIGMLSRCNNQSNGSYQWYGARGITCEFASLEDFINWAQVNGYKPGLTIDRKDVNGNYSPNNCQWITLQEQALNTTRNIYISHDGKRQTLLEWARDIGVKARTLYARHEHGWSPPRLFSPVNKRAPRIGGKS